MTANPRAHSASILRLVTIGAGAVIGILTLVLALSIVWPKPVVRMLAASSPDVLFFVETDRRAVALTLDDGPHAETTPAILDLLSRHGATATFFLIGERVEGLEHIVERIVAEGHEVGNHGMREETALTLSRDQLEASIDSADSAYGPRVSTKWFRPGSGVYDREMIEICRSRDLQIVLGSVYPFDTTVENPAYASWFILQNIEPGSIVVLHDHGENGVRTIETLDRLLSELTRRGFKAVSVSALVERASIYKGTMLLSVPGGPSMPALPADRHGAGHRLLEIGGLVENFPVRMASRS